MRGEQSVINKALLAHPECPVKRNIAELTPARIVEVIQAEYWDEWNRLLSYAETSSIYCRNIGKFYVGHSQLRGYLWSVLRELKRIREKKKAGLIKEGAYTLELEKTLKEKFRCAWQQWEEQRHMFILRTIRWNSKLKAKGEEHRIKYNYEQWEFTFVTSA